MTAYTMTIEQAQEILADVLAQPNWRTELWKIQAAGPRWSYAGYTKGTGAPIGFTKDGAGLRARAAFRIQQELSNPFLPFGKRRIGAWTKRQAARAASHEANAKKFGAK